MAFYRMRRSELTFLRVLRLGRANSWTLVGLDVPQSCQTPTQTPTRARQVGSVR